MSREDNPQNVKEDAVAVKESESSMESNDMAFERYLPEVRRTHTSRLHR